MLLKDLLDADLLTQHIEHGLVSVRRHPTLPLRIFNYTPEAAFSGTWDGVTTLCRGLIVDEDGVVVSRCMPKFFNLGQASTIIGTKADPREVNENVNVDAGYILDCVREWGSEMTITRKMDGQCGILFNYGGQWGISTRGSFESDGAKFATEKWQKFVKYGATEFVPKGWTLVFEVIDKTLRIVVPYDWSGLCLLTSVNNKTGEEMSYEQLRQVWLDINQYSKTLDADGNSVPGKPWCRLVEKFDISIQQAKDDPSMEEEGYVISVNRQGRTAVKSKVKLAEYCRLHKLLTGVTPQMVWAELAKPMNPWLSVDSRYDRKTGETTHSMQVPKEFGDWVRQWQRGLTQAFHEKLMKAAQAQKLLEHHLEHPLDKPLGLVIMDNDALKNEAEYREWLAYMVGKETAGFAMQLFRGRIVEAYESIWESVRPFGKDDRFYVEGKGE